MSAEFWLGYCLGVFAGVVGILDFQRRRLRRHTLEVDNWLERVRGRR